MIDVPPWDDEGDPGPASAILDDLHALKTSAPLQSARKFISNSFTRRGTSILHHQDGEFYEWCGTHYPAVNHSDMRARLYEFLEAAHIRKSDGQVAPFNPTRSKVGDILDALAAAANLPGDVLAPSWFGGNGKFQPADMIACKNGLLHLPSGELVPHTPEFWNHNALDFAHDPDAPPPEEWLAFLRDLWRDDGESIQALQEFFGYCLTADTRQQKIFLIVGPKRSGKGTLARVLSKLVGRENVANPTLASMSGEFGLQPLINKRLAIIADARLGGKVDQSIITERLLSISGEDDQTINRKNTSFWTGRLQTRFLVLTNELPRLADASGALASRFITLVLSNSFFGSEDHGLTDRLLGELPGILNWAIEGWRSLQARRYFVPPQSSQQAVRELEDLGSPISAFVRDRCVVGGGTRVLISMLFLQWGEWCRENGRDHAGTAQSFGRDLGAAVPGLKITQPRDLGRARTYEGIGLMAQENLQFGETD
jgi:putative DNA primase/helicase